MSNELESEDVVVDLLGSGRVRFIIDGQSYNWKRADIGFLAQMDEYGSKADDTKDETTYIQRWREWWEFMFKGLCDKDVEVDSLPAQFLNVTFIAEVRAHLWSRPLVRSQLAQEPAPPSTTTD